MENPIIRVRIAQECLKEQYWIATVPLIAEEGSKKKKYKNPNFCVILTTL